MAITSGAGPHRAWITVNGNQLPIERGSVEQQAVKKSSTFSAVIPMSYPGALAALANIEDNSTTVLVETRGTTNTLFTGAIDDISFDIIARTIRVSGRDKAAKLHENMSSEKWINKKGSDIVSDLAGRVGLDVTALAGQLLAGKNLQQDYVRLSDNVSFAYVIHKLAEFDGARWWVDNMGKFNYALANTPEGTYTLNYVPPNPYIKADFMKLTIKRNVQAGKTIKVKVNSWHTKDKKKYEKEYVIPGTGGTLQYNYHIPGLKQDHVDQHAKSRAKEHARHELNLSASVVGDPTINVAMGLQLNGTGYWDQMYEMDCVHHEIGMTGHRMTITAKSAKKGRDDSGGGGGESGTTSNSNTPAANQPPDDI